MLAREKSKVRSIYIYIERESSETIQNTLQQLEENNVTTVTELILSQKLIKLQKALFFSTYTLYLESKAAGIFWSIYLELQCGILMTRLTRHDQ